MYMVWYSKKYYFCGMKYRKRKGVKANEEGIIEYKATMRAKRCLVDMSPQEYIQSVLRYSLDGDGRKYRVIVGSGLKWNINNLNDYRGDIEWLLSEIGCRVNSIDVVGRFFFADVWLPAYYSPRKVAYWMRGYLSIVLGLTKSMWVKGYFCEGVGKGAAEGMVKFMRGG